MAAGATQLEEFTNQNKHLSEKQILPRMFYYLSKAKKF